MLSVQVSADGLHVPVWRKKTNTSSSLHPKRHLIEFDQLFLFLTLFLRLLPEPDDGADDLHVEPYSPPTKSVFSQLNDVRGSLKS